ALIIAANFFAGTPGSRAVRFGACTRSAGEVKFALLLLLELTLERIDGGGRSAGWNGDRSMCRRGRQRVGICVLEGRTLQLSLLQLLGSFDWIAIGTDDLHAEEMAGGVFLEAHHHALEHIEGLLLVGNKRVLLGVAAQPDAFLEVVHG